MQKCRDGERVVRHERRWKEPRLKRWKRDRRSIEQGGRASWSGSTEEGRRERVQLKLAQFSHSPVIRVPGIYIIKPRKFLSLLLPPFCWPRANIHAYTRDPDGPTLSACTLPLSLLIRFHPRPANFPRRFSLPR